MTLFVVFTSFNAWADDEAKLPDNGSGTEADPYLIATSADWNNLAEYVAADNNCKGLFFKMTANIGTTEEPITKPLGKQVGTNKKTDRRRFAGSFDGADSNGKPYTLTIALNTDNDWFYYNKGYCSPFAYTEGATIKNLHVAGTVTTTGPWASGLVGSTGDENNKDEATCTIDKCQISVALTANYISSDGKYGNHG